MDSAVTEIHGQGLFGHVFGVEGVREVFVELELSEVCREIDPSTWRKDVHDRTHEARMISLDVEHSLHPLRVREGRRIDDSEVEGAAFRSRLHEEFHHVRPNELMIPRALRDIVE